MYIEREHYLHLLKNNQDLTRDNQMLHHENLLLARELERQKMANVQLMQRFAHLEAEMAEYTKQIMTQNDSLHCDLKGNMEKLSQQQKQFIESKFDHLQTSSFQKYRLLEIKNRVNRIENHELTAFLDKVKKTYFTATDSKQEPSLKDLTKWIRALAGIPKRGERHLNQSKVNKQKEETSSSWKQNPRVKP